MKKSLQKIVSLSILVTFLATPVLAKAEINKEKVDNEVTLQEESKENKLEMEIEQQESNEEIKEDILQGNNIINETNNSETKSEDIENTDVKARIISSVEVKPIYSGRIGVVVNFTNNYRTRLSIAVQGKGVTNVISVEPVYNNFYEEFELENYGEYTIHVKASNILGFDSVYESYYFAPPLEGNFYQSSNVGIIGENITFTAYSSGGYGKHNYKFYKRHNGIETVLKDYSYSNSISTTFDKYGDYEVLVDIKDSNGTVKTLSLPFKAIVNEPHWKQENGEWYFVKDNGELAKGWLELGGRWYYLDEITGEMKKGWYDMDGNKYYFHNDGSMAKGWIKDNGQDYYLGNDGTLKTGWINDGWTDYFLKSDGTIYKGWLDDGLNKYFMDDNGQMRKGWVIYEDEYYYFGQDGAMRTGWINDGWTDYFLKSDGTIHKGWLNDGINKYFMDYNGQMRRGWIKTDGKDYYFGQDGTMKIGWINDGYAYYFLKGNGEVQTEWFDEGNSRYYLGDTGAMKTGWYKVDNQWHYFYSDGSLAINTSIDGWQIDSNGIATQI